MPCFLKEYFSELDVGDLNRTRNVSHGFTGHRFYIFHFYLKSGRMICTLMSVSRDWTGTCQNLPSALPPMWFYNLKYYLEWKKLFHFKYFLNEAMNICVAYALTALKIQSEIEEEVVQGVCPQMVFTYLDIHTLFKYILKCVFAFIKVRCLLFIFFIYLVPYHSIFTYNLFLLAYSTPSPALSNYALWFILLFLEKNVAKM